MIRIRAFRAIDDLQSCQRFAEGHANVLRDYGVTKVTSAKNDWFTNPDVYVVIIESEDGSITYGGERVHVANATHPLPIEAAVGIVDKRIYDLVREHARYSTAELCGLWNSKAIAGHGTSILLTKIGVAMAIQLRLHSLFVLCAPYTVQMAQMCGFAIETSIGNKGTFYYPKLDLVATSLIVRDLVNLPEADEAVREEIQNFIINPVQTLEVQGPKGKLAVSIDLTLKPINSPLQ